MALAGSGAMRMGADVNVELGSASTTQISLGQASVRTLIGVASGAVSFPTNFYGKSSGYSQGIFYGGNTSYPGAGCSNTVTRINSCGALVGSQTTVGTARQATGGAPVGSNGLFYAGQIGAICSGGTKQNTATRINSSGALVGSTTTVGTARQALAGALVGSNGLFYGGSTGGAVVNTTTRINSCGALVGSQTTPAGTARQALGGAPVGSNGLFYGGVASTCIFCSGSQTATRINSCGALVGSQTTPGCYCRLMVAGALVGSNGLFYTSDVYGVGATNAVTRINSCGALVGSETNAGTARRWGGGAAVGGNGLFYGGYGPFGYSLSNTATRINSCGALVGSETTIGTARGSISGAST